MTGGQKKMIADTIEKASPRLLEVGWQLLDIVYPYLLSVFIIIYELFIGKFRFMFLSL
jgi:hypothetical protein